MELNISGIKCDTHHCNYRDDDVKFEEYPSWVDRPCPLCGANLLTQKSYNSCIRMKRIVRVITALRWINPIFYIRSGYRLITGKKAKYAHLHVKFENDGSITKKQWEENEN